MFLFLVVSSPKLHLCLRTPIQTMFVSLFVSLSLSLPSCGVIAGTRTPCICMCVSTLMTHDTLRLPICVACGGWADGGGLTGVVQICIFPYLLQLCSGQQHQHQPTIFLRCSLPFALSCTPTRFHLPLLPLQLRSRLVDPRSARPSYFQTT